MEEIKSDAQENVVPDNKNDVQTEAEELNQADQDKVVGGHLYF